MNKKLSKIALDILGIILALICLSPFYIIIVNSFKKKGELFESTLALPEKFNLDNYTRAWEQLDFIKVLGNSLFITVISIVFIVLFASMAAWMLQRTNSKISNMILFIFISSMLVTFQSIMLPLINIMGKLNLLNVPGIIFMYIGFGSASAIFLYHGFVKSIPKELDEAALIDGCSKWQTFRYIIFPLLKPISITVAILNTVWIWNDFLLPFLTVNGKINTIPLAMNNFFGAFSKQWELAMAALVLAIIPIIIFYFIVQKHIIAGIVQGSIK